MAELDTLGECGCCPGGGPTQNWLWLDSRLARVVNVWHAFWEFAEAGTQFQTVATPAAWQCRAQCINGVWERYNVAFPQIPAGTIVRRLTVGPGDTVPEDLGLFRALRATITPPVAGPDWEAVASGISQFQYRDDMGRWVSLNFWPGDFLYAASIDYSDPINYPTGRVIWERFLQAREDMDLSEVTAPAVPRPTTGPSVPDFGWPLWAERWATQFSVRMPDTGVCAQSASGYLRRTHRAHVRLERQTGADPAVIVYDTDVGWTVEMDINTGDVDVTQMLTAAPDPRSVPYGSAPGYNRYDRMAEAFCYPWPTGTPDASTFTLVSQSITKDAIVRKYARSWYGYFPSDYSTPPSVWTWTIEQSVNQSVTSDPHAIEIEGANEVEVLFGTVIRDQFRMVTHDSALASQDAAFTFVNGANLSPGQPWYPNVRALESGQNAGWPGEDVRAHPTQFWYPRNDYRGRWAMHCFSQKWSFAFASNSWPGFTRWKLDVGGSWEPTWIQTPPNGAWITDQSPAGLSRCFYRPVQETVFPAH